MMKAMLIFWTALAVAAADIVTDLTASTFDDFISTNPLSLISFGVSTCEFCEQLAPEFAEAASLLQGEKWPLAQVDCDEQQPICERYGIGIYPTILAFHGKETQLFDGRQKSGAMVAFMHRQSRPVISTLRSMDEVEDFKEKDRVVVIGNFENSDEQSNSAFFGLAKKYRGFFSFARTSSEMTMLEGMPSPSVVLYKTFDEGVNTFEGTFDAEQHEKFLVDAAIPLIEEMGEDRYYAPKDRFAAIFVDDKTQQAELIEMLRPVARSTRDDFIWIVADPVEHANLLPQVALTSGAWPAFGFVDSEADTVFAYSARGSVRDLNATAIQKVLDEHKAGLVQSAGRDVSFESNESVILDHEEL